MVKGKQLDDSLIRSLHAWKAWAVAKHSKAPSPREMSLYLQQAGLQQGYRSIATALQKKTHKTEFYKKPRYMKEKTAIIKKEEGHIMKWVAEEQLYGISTPEITRRLNHLREESNQVCLFLY